MTERARIVCFGELLLRLSAPDGERLMQSPTLVVHVGGSEANVAVSLARFGHDAAIVSVVPDNELGAAAIAEMRRHGVATDGIARGPGRMGLYFLTPGAVSRPASVLYDRAGSAFALAGPGADDWASALSGASWLNLSGITSALGEQAAAANRRAASEAASRGIPVAFDCNYRKQLWATSGGDARRTLHAMLAGARLAFLDDRDAALILGVQLTGSALERRRAAATAAFSAFPELERVCSTIRDVDSVDRQRITCVMYTRTRELVSRTHTLDGIVDRVGAGDAFTAGVLHGLVSGHDEQRTLEVGAAAAALKHSICGDFNLVDLAD